VQVPSYRRSIAFAEPAFEPEPEHGYTDEVTLAEIRAAKVEYLHAAVDALAAVELWLALDAWIPDEGIRDERFSDVGIPDERHDAA
jgi:hypothetical protein